MKAEPANQLGFLSRLRSIAADPPNPYDLRFALPIEAIKFFPGKFQQWLKQTHLRITNGELGGMDTHRHASGTCGTVITKQRPLPPLIESAAGVESKRARRDNQPLPQRCVYFRVHDP